MEHARRVLRVGIAESQDIQAARLTAIEQEIGEAIAPEVRAEFLIISASREA
jgi:hypothetical protein